MLTCWSQVKDLQFSFIVSLFKPTIPLDYQQNTLLLVSFYIIFGESYDSACFQTVSTQLRLPAAVMILEVIAVSSLAEVETTLEYLCISPPALDTAPRFLLQIFGPNSRRKLLVRRNSLVRCKFCDQCAWVLKGGGARRYSQLKRTVLNDCPVVFTNGCR